MIRRELRRFLQIAVAFFLYSFGIYLCIHANVGLAPWDAFASGIASAVGTSYGVINVATGLTVLLISVGIFKEKFGISTPLNTVLIGMGVDVIESWNLLPYLDHFFGGILMLLTGQFFICVGTVLYIPLAMGGGPRDSLMLALAKRFPKVRIGVVRGCIEGTVLSIGWLFGAKVGIGTVIAVFGIGTMLQLTCTLFHSDLKGVVHESCLDTLRRWKTEYLAEKASAAR